MVSASGISLTAILLVAVIVTIAVLPRVEGLDCWKNTETSMIDIACPSNVTQCYMCQDSEERGCLTGMSPTCAKPKYCNMDHCNTLLCHREDGEKKGADRFLFCEPKAKACFAGVNCIDYHGKFTEVFRGCLNPGFEDILQKCEKPPYFCEGDRCNDRRILVGEEKNDGKEDRNDGEKGEEEKNGVEPNGPSSFDWLTVLFGPNPLMIVWLLMIGAMRNAG